MADDESGGGEGGDLILLTHPPHGKSNAIDSLSQESDQTVYQARLDQVGGGVGEGRTEQLTSHLTRFSAESQVWH